MSEEKSVELRVSVDVGYRRHSVAMGLSSGELLEEFEIDHRPEGFQEFFSRIEKHLKQKNCPVAVAMEGYNGHARRLERCDASAGTVARFQDDVIAYPVALQQPRCVQAGQAGSHDANPCAAHVQLLASCACASMTRAE